MPFTPDTPAQASSFTPDNAPVKKSSFVPDAVPQRDLNSEFHPLRELTRGGGAIRSMLQGRGFVEGATHPENVPSFASLIPVQPGASEPQLWGNAAVGAIADMGIDPLNVLPLPIGKAVGSVVSGLAKEGNPLAQGIARWTATHLPNLAPNVSKTAASLEPNINNQIVDAVNKQSAAPINVAASETPPKFHMVETIDGMQPVPTGHIDQTDAYQTWLQQNAQPKSGSNPFFDVPLHPASEGRAEVNALQAQEPVSIPGEQQLGLRGFQSTPKNLLQPEKLPFENPIGPVRDQGQQMFDFTKGPQEPPAGISPVGAAEAPIAQPALPQENAIQMSAQMQKEIDQIARTPNGARSPAYKGLSRDQIAEIFNNRVKNKPVVKTELPPEFDTARPTMKPLTSGDAIHMGDTYEMTATEADRARREQLLADRASVDQSPVGGDYGTVNEGAIPDNALPVPKGAPTAIEDLETIIRDIHLKKKDPNIIEFGAGVKPPDFELGPEGQAAMQRFRTQHALELKEYLKTAGNTAEKFVASKVPHASEAVIKTMAHHMLPEKLGTTNIGLQNFSPETATQAKDIAENHFVDTGKSRKGETMTRAESIGRANTQGAKDTAEALSNIDTRNSAAGMTRLGMDAQQALEDIVGKKASPEAIQKAAAALDDFSRAGTVAGRLLQSRKNIIANAQEFLAQSKILFENGDITPAEMEAINAGVTKLGQIPDRAQEKFWRRLHELGVNNMLSMMSNLRNITGNVVSAPFAPLDRAIQGGLNLAARPINKAVGALTKDKWKPFVNTDVVAREASRMVASYAENLPTGLKMGGRYFVHETDSAVFKSIKNDIAKVKADTTLSPEVKAKKLAALEKQKAASLETIQGGNAGDNFAEQGGLTHSRAIPGPIGYMINTPARGLSAMDQVFRIPLRQGAEDAIKVRIGLKTGTPWRDVKLTPQQIEEGAHEAAYYTYNQALGSFGKKVQAAIQPKTAAGYAAGNVLVFMKNAVNVGKWALDHGALTTGSALLDPMIGPLLNRVTQKGSHALDTKALAKSIAGLGVAYTSYAMMKKGGWSFYLNSDPDNFDEATQRKVAGLPVDLFAKDGQGNIHSLQEIYPMTFFFQKMAAWDTAQRLADRGVPPTDVKWSNFKNQADVFMDASTLTGTKDIMSAWENALKQAKPSVRAADEVDPITKYLSKQASARLTSAFLDEINRMYLDKTQRSPNTPAQYFEARTPGLSKNVPAKVAWTGQDVKRPDVYSPLHELVLGRGNIKDLDPVQTELVRLGVYPAPVAKSQDGVRFTNEERNRVLKTYGPMALNAVKSIMSDPGYAKMPEFMKYSMVNEALKVQDAGQEQMVGEHALADMNKYFKLQTYRETKGRSLSSDQSNATVFPR